MCRSCGARPDGGVHARSFARSCTDCSGANDALHPQWVVIDMGTARAVNAIHIQWVNPYAVVYVVQYWVGDNNAMDWDMGPNGMWK
ncbi:MAG: hypothetical protein WA485_18510, partial [Candidatus Sulfotelmatobacter sp.]